MKDCLSPRPSLGRRRFVVGLAGCTAAAGLGWPLVSLGEPARTPQTLTGQDFNLEVGTTPVNYTGRMRLATTVNGSLPGPLLRWRQGEEVRLQVSNRLAVPTSIHWHGILLPYQMDGVPGISFPGIAPGETFTYCFPVLQAGTYWYHSHSGFQEQVGHYGPLVIEPRGGESIPVDRDHVVMLNDWTDESPERIFSHLKASSDYYNYQQPTLVDFWQDVATMGLTAARDKRRMWNRMRMKPTDFQDVSGSTYTYLVNGAPPASNWTAIARAGERVRLRLINGSAETFFDIRIPGLKMTVIAADGQAVRPVEVDELRIAVAETYDVLVTMPDNRAYTIFCQAMDRSGYARATLAPEPGMQAAIPPLDPKTWLSMADMGMDHDMASMPAHEMPGMAQGSEAGPTDPAMHGAMHDHDMAGMDHGAMNTGTADHAGHHGTHEQHMSPPSPAAVPPDDLNPAVDMRVRQPSNALDDPGPRLRDNGRRVLTYADLHTLGGSQDERPAGRDIVLRLTGNMERFIWGFDGVKYNDAAPIHLAYGERVRFVLINDTMMNHPIHLHGMFSEIEHPDRGFQVRKHTVNVQPGKRVSFLVTADAPGEWAFHCHLLYHMEAGMFRKVVVA